MLSLDHVDDRVDQGEVGERLREVTHLPAGARVDLLRVQVQRAGQRQQLLAQLLRPFALPDLAERGHQEERADRERALRVGHAVVHPASVVAQHQPVHRQLVGDGQDGGPDAGVAGRQEPGHREQQQRGIQGGGAVMLDEHPALIHPVRQDVLADQAGLLPPGPGQLLLAPRKGGLRTLLCR